MDLSIFVLVIWRACNNCGKQTSKHNILIFAEKHKRKTNFFFFYGMMFSLPALLTIVLHLVGSWEMSLAHHLNQASSAVRCVCISCVWTPKADSILCEIRVQPGHCPSLQQGLA